LFRYKSDPRDIQKILQKTEKIILKLEKSSNPDFINLKIQFRLVVSKMLLDSNKFANAIETLCTCFGYVELELKIRLERLKNKEKV
jgi:hypothetical protein